MTGPFYILSNNLYVMHFRQTLTTTWCYHRFSFFHFDEWLFDKFVAIVMVIVGNSWIAKELEYLFMCLFAIYISFSIQHLFMFFAHFLIELLCLFYCWVLRGICVFQVQYLCPSYDWKIFPPVCALSFHISNRFFSDQKLSVYQFISFSHLQILLLVSSL